MEKQKLNNKEKADEHKFKGGCGKDTSSGLIPYICGKTEVFNSPKDEKGKIYFCPDCQAKKKIQEIKKEVLG